MGQNSITMFSNDSGAAGGPIAYVQDAFPDISNRPTNNNGFSSTLSKNPLNDLFGNDDFPRYGPKTLWIKDLVLEDDRTKWINGEPTYRVIWNECYPSISGYVYGNIQLIRSGDQTFVRVKSVGDGFGVTGVLRRVMFLMIGNTASAGNATGTIAVDGVNNATTIDWSNLATGNPANTNLYAATVHANSNETYDIHDFRLKANQAGSVFTIAGVVVYSENSTLTIDQFPGSTYNNKTKSTTTNNTSISLPAFSASLGGRSVIWKNAASGYSMSTIGVSTIQSIATGSSGTNILNLTAGHGSSFSAGYGVIAYSGSSAFVGVIQSISTDALTVYPTLAIGISGSIYRYFQAGQSLALNASFNMLAYTFGSTEMSRTGFSTTYLDPTQNFCVWGTNLGQTAIDGIWTSLSFLGASGFLQCEGYFSAADIEWVGQSFGVLSGTMVVNGLPVYNHANIGFTGILKKSVFLEAGPGWNQFAFFPGSSHINVAINRINLYNRRRDISASYGLLAEFDTLQSFVPRATNATLVAPGTFQRVFADQLLFKGLWTRSVGGTQCGGVMYSGSTTTASLQFQYYGTHFAVLGLGTNASLNMSIDGVSTATVFNSVIQTPTLGFHTVGISLLGGTNIISAIDFFRTTGEMKNIQTFSGFTAIASSMEANARYNINALTGLSNTITIIYPNKEYDNLNQYKNGSYTVIVPGLYRVTASYGVQTGSTYSAGDAVGITILQNGVAKSSNIKLIEANIASSLNNITPQTSATLKCKAGDVISIQATGNLGGVSTSSGADQNFIEIIRIG